MNVKEDRFNEVLKKGTMELLKVIANIIFPCLFISVTAKNFEKIKKFGADLGSFAAGNGAGGKDKDKQQRQQGQQALNFFKKPPVQAIETIQNKSSMIHEKENNDIPATVSMNNNLKEQSLYSEDLTENSNTKLFLEENSHKMEQEEEPQPQEEMFIMTQKIEEEEEEEIVKTECEKCGEMVSEKDLVDHYDFHIAQDLDKELNPNKRKYRQIDNDHVMVSVEGKEHKEKKEPEIVAQPRKMVENQNNLLGVGFKGGKKNQPGPEQGKDQGKKKVVQMKSLDSFFSKK